MKILVCISKTPETTAKITFTDGDTKFNEDGVQYILNPYDEWYALVRALELVEANGGEVVLGHVGPAANDSIIRKGLAVGAHRAVRIDADPLSAEMVAKQIASHAATENYDLILCGKETIDYNGAIIGGLIAAELTLPYVSFVSHLEVSGSEFTLTRDIEGGVEVSKVNGPIVISASKGLAEQRIPKMKDIMMSKRKPIDVIEAVSTDPTTTIIKYSLPQGKQGVKMLGPDDMDELVRLLNEEAKVL